MPQSYYPSKVFVIEWLRMHGREGDSETVGGAVTGDIEYRIGYYVIGKIGNRRGRWTWGQYCPLIPHGDLLPLIERAKEKERSSRISKRRSPTLVGSPLPSPPAVTFNQVSEGRHIVTLSELEAALAKQPNLVDRPKPPPPSNKRKRAGFSAASARCKSTSPPQCR